MSLLKTIKPHFSLLTGTPAHTFSAKASIGTRERKCMAPHPQSDPGPGRLHTPGLRPGIYNRIGSTQYRVIISRYMQRSSEALRSDREVNDRQIRMCRS